MRRREILAVPASIRIATLDDAAPLADFASAIFRDTFGPDNTRDDMDAYVAEAFTVERQRATLADPSALMLVAEDDAGIAGYALLRESPPPDVVSGSAALEIERFYVAVRWQGRGLARRLMEAMLDAARARGADAVWLGVWERNARAIGFYEKTGFTRVGSHRFMLGSDAQTDLLMARSLPARSS